MASNVISFKGEFDVSQILASIKQIRSQMGEKGLDSGLFKNIDKDIEKAEKLINSMTAQVQKGFDSKSLKQYNGQLDKLEETILRAAAGLKNVGSSENFLAGNKNLQKAISNLATLTAKAEDLQQAAKDELDEKSKSLGITKKEAEELKKNLSSAEDLEAAWRKIAKAKADAAQGKLNQKAFGTTAGGLAISESSLDASILDLGVTRKKADSSRASLKTGKGANASVNMDQAQIAINQEYVRILGEVMEKGGTAAQVVEQLTEIMTHYGVAIGNTSELESQVATRMGEIAEAAKAEEQELGNNVSSYTRYQNAIEHFSEEAVSGTGQITEGMTAAVEAAAEVETATQEVVTATENATLEAEQSAATTEQGTEQVTNAMREEGEQQRKNIDLTGEQIEKQTELNRTFDNLKRAVAQLFSITSIFRMLRNVVQETFNDVQKLDKAFASIAMVTSYSVEEMWQSYDKYANMANELGQSTESVIQASALFYQQGKLILKYKKEGLNLLKFYFI